MVQEREGIPPLQAIASASAAAATEVSFWRRVFQFQQEKIAPWIGLRNTLGFALPLAAGVALGSIPAALIAGIGALNVSYSDSHDPYLQRARRMLTACALAALHGTGARGLCART